MMAAGRRDRIQGRVVAANAETGQQVAGAVGVEGGQRDQPGVPAMGQRRQVEARGQHHDAGQRFRRQFFQQSAELGVEEPSLPGAVVVLRHLGAVEDQAPSVRGAGSAADDRRSSWRTRRRRGRAPRRRRTIRGGTGRRLCRGKNSTKTRRRAGHRGTGCRSSQCWTMAVLPCPPGPTRAATLGSPPARAASSTASSAARPKKRYGSEVQWWM